MTTSALCRACLTSSHDMFSIADTGLQVKFETLTRIMLKTKDGRSEKLCYICCALLQKFYNFVSMTQNSDRIFTIFHARNILVSKNTVSKLKLKKHKFSFSRLKSVCIDFSPKTPVPVPDIKKEVIEINKNTYAEVVQISDIIKDYAYDSVDNDLMIGQNVMSDNSIKMEHSSGHDHIVSDPLVNLVHISEKNQNRVSNTSMNLEHSPAVATVIHPQEIKQEIIEIDKNYDVVIIDDNDTLPNFVNHSVKKEPDIIENQIYNLPAVDTVIDPREIQQEAIDIDQTSDIQMLEVNDILNNFNNQSVKNELMLTENRIANTSVSLERSLAATVIQNIKPEIIEIDNNTYEEVFKLTGNVKNDENHLVKKEPNFVKQEIIEIDEDNDAGIIDDNNKLNNFENHSVKKEPVIIENQISNTSVNLEHLPVIPIVRRPNRIKQNVAEVNKNIFAKRLEMTNDFENNSLKETPASVNLENSPVVATVRHPHKLKQKIIEIDKNAYAEMLEMTDILEKFKNSSAEEPVIKENQITDNSVNSEHVSETSTHLPLIGTISYPHRISGTSMNFKHSPIISTMTHQGKASDTLVNSEHLPIVSIVRHPHRMKQNVSQIIKKSFAETKTTKDFGNLKENSSGKTVVSEVSLDNRVTDTIAISEPTLLSNTFRQHQGSGISMNLEHIPVHPSSAIENPHAVSDKTVSYVESSVRYLPKDNDVSVNVDHSPAVAIVRHPHKLKQEVIEIDKNTYAEMLEMTDLLDNFENHAVNGHPFVEENHISDTSVNLEHSPVVATVIHPYGVNCTSMNKNHLPVHSGLINLHSGKNTSLSFEQNPEIATAIQPIRIQQEIIKNYENNNLKIREMNGNLKDFENRLVNRHPKMVYNHISDTSMNLEHTPVISTTSTLRNHQVTGDLINSLSIPHKANDTTINLKRSREPSTERHKHRIRDNSMNPELSSLRHRYGTSDTLDNRKRTPVRSTMAHRHRTSDDSMYLKRSREASTETRRRHRSRDDLKRSSPRRHRDYDTSKRSRESSKERRRYRASNSSITLERFSLIHHHRAYDTSKNRQRSPVRSKMRYEHRISEDSMTLDRSSLRHQHKPSDTSANLEHTPLRSQHKASDTSVNLEHTPLRPEHKASDTSVNMKRSPVASTEKHLQKASDTSVNLEHTPLRPQHTVTDTSMILNRSPVVSTEKHPQQASETSVDLEQTFVNSTLNHHTLTDTSVNLKHSVVPMVKHTNKDDELIHPGLSPISSDEDDDLFILNRKDPPCPIDENNLAECLENETPLVIDEKESDSLEQLQQRLIKEQLILEQLLKDEEDLLNGSETSKEEKPSMNESDTSGSPQEKHEASTCCQEHACIRSDNARLRPCDYGLHRAADECMSDAAIFVPFGCGTHKFENLSSLYQDERSSVNKGKCTRLKHCKASQCYSCSDCYRTFKSRRNLYNHIKQKHPDMQILGCNKCDTIITSYTDFIGHYKLSHPGEKYPDNECKMKFRTLKRLASHKDNDHEIKIKQIYKCDTCDKSFDERLDFKFHELFDHPPEINKYSELF